ncbi:FeoA family protein [Salegentibacter salarius]|nr:FeoA family protein [Salegentibacter salarius]OEY71256.1 iron transporter [Salegentibacter salarius]PKD15752.1 iron transporter [Salegentibacter salarius]SLJ92222.1 ferrous iron transport protein A [Salegentibacter salarius]
MKRTLADLKRGERGIIKEFSEENIPLKLLEMGCLPGNEVEMLQMAPFRDPMYLNINGSHLAIRREIALLIEIDLISLHG